jgi:hydroxyacylglutathione hydrolase
MTLLVHQFPSLEDNYGFLARDAQTGLVACVDPADAGEVLEQLQSLQWGLDFILNTHWHGDHTGGNEALRNSTGARVIGPAEVSRRSVVDRIISPGEQVELGSTRFEVLDTGGHTAEHVTYFDPASQIAFVGDTLFAMGCGRIFEGTIHQMWASLSQIAALPPSTIVYCAHEYTEANGRFAVAHDDSPSVHERYAQVVELRRAGQWTVPTTVEKELQTNPFLRAPSLMPDMDPAEAFGALRAAKDSFRG